MQFFFCFYVCNLWPLRVLVICLIRGLNQQVWWCYTFLIIWGILGKLATLLVCYGFLW